MPYETYRQKPPASKRELLNRMLSYDFDGDIRKLGGGEPTSIVRRGASALELRFPSTGQTFLLTVHIPREENKLNKELRQEQVKHDEEWAVEPPTTRRAGRKQ